MAQIAPHRVVDNPGYMPEHSPDPRYGVAPLREHPDGAVRESFARDGVINPVLVWARWGGLWVRWGGSRVAHYRRHGVDTIPAVIDDYDGRFPDLPAVETIELAPVPAGPEDIEFVLTGSGDIGVYRG